MSKLDSTRLKEVLNYDPDTGIFTWIISNRSGKGSQANCLDGDGYIRIQIDKKRYQAHRLAWLYVYGEFPPDELDHINRVRNDNSIKNLRLSNRKRNNENKSIYKNNLCGHKNISFKKSSNTWRVRKVINGIQQQWGGFKTLQEAIDFKKEQTWRD